VAKKKKTVVLVTEVEGLTDAVTGTVYAIVTLTVESAIAMLRMRSLWQMCAMHMGKDFALYGIECWDYQVEYFCKITQPGYADEPPSVVSEGVWCVAGRGIAGQPADDTMFGTDVFNAEACRMQIRDQGITWTGYVKYVDNCPEFSMPELTWSDLEAIARGDKPQLTVLNARKSRAK